MDSLTTCTWHPRNTSLHKGSLPCQSMPPLAPSPVSLPVLGCDSGLLGEPMEITASDLQKKLQPTLKSRFKVGQCCLGLSRACVGHGIGDLSRAHSPLLSKPLPCVPPSCRRLEQAHTQGSLPCQNSGFGGFSESTWSLRSSSSRTEQS